ncbi:S-Ena type endospore appendage [Sporosarcina obsidiansis]|uniref:S-Ena type endospore appendage n=1 Tax=Sporosarcina obsidiansis TaxID=2660748 RepID=UPI00129BE9CE|nr:S-Ena type endospore appendage [Sporosarcina obsidiansis]
MTCKNDCFVSRGKWVAGSATDAAVKCVCKSVPFEVRGPRIDDYETIFYNPQSLLNIGVYTVVNYTNADMTIEFEVDGPGDTTQTIPAGGSITVQLQNLERIRVRGTSLDNAEDGRLDFEICFPLDFTA